MNSYITVIKQGGFNITVSRSEFIAVADHAESEEQARELIAAQKKKYSDARHVCWAYVIGEKSDIVRFSDDGEPQGTAGLPILNIIQKHGLTNTLITVTRYFGGILLGTGGLTRAYSSAALGAQENAVKAKMQSCTEYVLKIDYTAYSKNEHSIKADKNIHIVKTEYSDAVEILLKVPREYSFTFEEKIKSLFDGKVVPQKGKTQFDLLCSSKD